ncbi:site-specific integrase [Paraburkholderia sp. JPY419]|uniref:site-specific integrase n=1 Tax=Paraburkholderia sp. JPY419 TaxID=667660 RepID=UPI003D250C96
MAALLLGAGLRANELIQLPVSCFDERRYVVRVVPEGPHRAHTTRVLPDGPWREWLDQWLMERVSLSIPGPLLCPATRKGNALCPSALYRRVSGWLKDANVEAQRGGAGVLRNTFVRSALTCGRYSLAEVQEFLGHEFVRSTARSAPSTAKNLVAEAKAVERLAIAAQEAQSASLALKAHFRKSQEGTPAAPHIARLTVAAQELQAARDDLDALLTGVDVPR